ERELVISNCECGISRTLNPRGCPDLTIRNSQFEIRNSSYGPRGSRTHYPSIKSRELILMSFRPKTISNCEFRIANFGLHLGISTSANSQFAISLFAILMLRPRLELGSRTDLVLAGY